jgi:hypothetical protein
MVDIDERAWPLVVFRFRGRTTMEELERYLQRQEAMLARQQPMASLVLAEEAKLWETPVMRRQAEWIKARKDELRRLSLGAALVIPSPVIRGMLKAILWIQPMPQPHTVVATPEEGLRWLREQVRRANAAIAIPDRL